MPRISPDGIIQAPAIVLPSKGSTKRQLADWLKAFLEYTAELESPINYFRWAGLSTIAGAAQRKIFAETPAFTIFPNLYVVLCGPAGVKKSTAIRMGKRLLKQVPGVNLSSDSPSVAGLIVEFTQITNVAHQSMSAFIGEMSTLYENAPDTMTGFLTAFYDGDDDYIKSTRSSKKEHITKPWLNLIAATTPSWLGDNLSRSAVEGGLVARTLYVYSEEVNLKNPFPEYTPALRRLESALVNDLIHISTLYGNFGFAGGKGAAAWEWYKKWYLDRSRLPAVADNRTSGYFTRKPQHLLRVALLVSLAKRDDLLYTVEDLEVGLALLAALETGMAKTFSSVGGNTFATDLERIASQIKSGGKDGMLYPSLIAANYHQLNKKLLDETLDYLCAANRIKLGRIPDTMEKVYVAVEYVSQVKKAPSRTPP